MTTCTAQLRLHFGNLDLSLQIRYLNSMRSGLLDLQEVLYRGLYCDSTS
jgi:hypothetical protein